MLISKRIRKSKEREKEKEKEKKNVFTRLQVCFLRDVRVIWYRVIDNNHFQTNVIEVVENLFNYYLHITSYVSHTLTSCTHYT